VLLSILGGREVSVEYILLFSLCNSAGIFIHFVGEGFEMMVLHCFCLMLVFLCILWGRVCNECIILIVCNNGSACIQFMSRIL
jgi:hypothetical protein